MKASELVPVEANENIPAFQPGDTVRVNFRIREGNRERVQAFQGVCIRRTHGTGPAANFTVRRITAGIGIERVFPLHSPLIESLEVTRQGKVRRAKLYYLREGRDAPPASRNGRLTAPIGRRHTRNVDRRPLPSPARLRRFRIGNLLRLTRISTEGVDSEVSP